MRLPRNLVFFDSQKANRALTRQQNRVFNRFGATVRRVSRRSIRKRKRAAAAGMPPSSHTGALKRNIYYALDLQKKSVVVGALQFTGRPMVPAALEHGGYSSHKNPRRRRRSIGDAGIIRLDEGTGKAVRDYRNNRRMAVFGKITTEAQLRRVERNEEAVWGPFEIRGVVHQHPYMEPAFEKVLPDLPRMYLETPLK